MMQSLGAQRHIQNVWTVVGKPHCGSLQEVGKDGLGFWERRVLTTMLLSLLTAKLWDSPLNFSGGLHKLHSTRGEQLCSELDVSGD